MQPLLYRHSHCGDQYLPPQAFLKPIMSSSACILQSAERPISADAVSDAEQSRGHAGSSLESAEARSGWTHCPVLTRANPAAMAMMMHGTKKLLTSLGVPDIMGDDQDWLHTLGAYSALETMASNAIKIHQMTLLAHGKSLSIASDQTVLAGADSLGRKHLVSASLG